MSEGDADDKRKRERVYTAESGSSVFLENFAVFGVDGSLELEASLVQLRLRKQSRNRSLLAPSLCIRKYSNGNSVSNNVILNNIESK
ncbi:hypothetical protein CEXT_540701 [Caerostris extrusa]|uniref:Uncharacterized protein n=1 Tax=Caerostris extrusa TaxID=172846 RepID=A0AAV4XL36_CAEEX|nr:hypothetical protein CEXT_540701 [Caerostris extrusa]